MFQPAEKACWEILLREYPDFQHVAPAVLDEAMTKTLRQLWAVLSADTFESWLKEQDDKPPFATRGDCALNALLPYFNTGRRALELIINEFGDAFPELTESERLRMGDELSAGFKVLLHWQLEGSCSRCPQSEGCRFGGTRDLPAALITAKTCSTRTPNIAGATKSTSSPERVTSRQDAENKRPKRSRGSSLTQAGNSKVEPAKEPKRAERAKLSSRG